MDNRLEIFSNGTPFPNDVWKEIFKYLDVLDFARLAKASKSFNGVVQAYFPNISWPILDHSEQIKLQQDFPIIGDLNHLARYHVFDNGDFVLSHCDGSFCFYQFPQYIPLQFSGNGSIVTNIKRLSDGNLVTNAIVNNKIIIWDLKSGNSIDEIQLPTKANIYHFLILKNDDLLLAEEKKIHLYTKNIKNKYEFVKCLELLNPCRNLMFHDPFIIVGHHQNDSLCTILDIKYNSYKEIKYDSLKSILNKTINDDKYATSQMQNAFRHRVLIPSYLNKGFVWIAWGNINFLCNLIDGSATKFKFEYHLNIMRNNEIVVHRSTRDSIYVLTDWNLINRRFKNTYKFEINIDLKFSTVSPDDNLILYSKNNDIVIFNITNKKYTAAKLVDTESKLSRICLGELNITNGGNIVFMRSGHVIIWNGFTGEVLQDFNLQKNLGTLEEVRGEILPSGDITSLAKIFSQPLKELTLNIHRFRFSKNQTETLTSTKRKTFSEDTPENSYSSNKRSRNS